MNQTQKDILEQFYLLQCDQDDGSFQDDETPLMLYFVLEKGLKLNRSELKPHVIALRNEGFIELVPSVDGEYYRPNGSGWVLTDKGQKLVKELFFSVGIDDEQKG